jgi:DNA-nicking Smr family endonuclease
VRRIPIEDSFDLHSFRHEDILSALEEYLHEARAAGFREVRVIHGKGRGDRRAQVRKWLATQPGIDRISDAPPERGGSGATIVLLA